MFRSFVTRIFGTFCHNYLYCLSDEKCLALLSRDLLALFYRDYFYCLSDIKMFRSFIT